MFLFLKSPKRKKGQAMIIATVFFVFVSVAAILGMTNPMVRHIAMATSVIVSKESFYAAEAGIEDIVYRLESGKAVSPSQTLVVGDHSVVTTVNDELGGKIVVALGEANDYLRRVQTHLILGTGISFHYGIQSGRGGFVLQNSSSVTGNVYSGGPIIGAGNFIYGDMVSSGPTGSIDSIYSTGNAYANDIRNSVIEKDAYYKTINTTNVWGNLHPDSADQPEVPLPISDDQINEWENDSVAGGIIDGEACSSGTYTVTSDITLGPVKINCNLLIKGNGINFVIAGPIWVVGNITTQTSPIIKMASSLGSQNVSFIADKTLDRINSSKIDIGQGTQFQGSGFPNSFVFLISQNNSSETGGSIDAINVGQSAGALVAYASHGQITLGQSVNVKEATAYKIVLKNTANVVYDTGLPSTLFSSGPTGGFEISGWREVE